MSKTIEIVITEVRLTAIQPIGGMVAMARVVLNNAIALDSIGIHTKLSGGYRLTYPNKNGRQLYQPISKAAGIAIENAIFNEVSKYLKAVNHDRHGCPDSAT